MATAQRPLDAHLDAVTELAAQLRVDSIRSSTSAGSGHPTSSMSAADLLAVLITRHLRYDWDHPRSPVNDHLIFSKGHASPLLYAVFKAAGVVSEQELMTGYRRFGQRLEGHPTPILPWVDFATGSLGQGLPDGVGVALAGKYLERQPYRVWVLCGDSELAEGSIWEAFDKASYYQLSNLIAIVDVNRLGQRGETDLGWHIDAYARRVEAFGARALVINGHDLAAIDGALATAGDGSGLQPTAIIARTIKGRGFSEIENKPGWHGKPLPPDMAERAITKLGGVRNRVVRGPCPPAPSTRAAATAPAPATALAPRYVVGHEVAPRKAYGDALVGLGARDPRVVAVDGEVSNSTYTDEFARAYPDRYFEMFIAEQQMVAAATGIATRGYRVFASTFAAFMTRAYDFIRMGAISGVDLRLVGSHCGVEIGADGPSQMGLEDLAMMRAVQGSTVLYPSDGTSTAALVDAMARLPGISYLRTTRGAYPVLYADGEAFPVGGAKLVRASDHDQITLVGAGVTLHACLRAADLLHQRGIAARVIDCYSVKPIDTATLIAAADATAGRIVVAEDHHPEGGLGSAVTDALVEAGRTDLRIARLAVRGIPGSGSGEQLLAWAGIDGDHIAAAARRLVEPGAADRPRLGLPAQITACLFDLDGVLTQTASVHAAAWKQTFDDYLRSRSEPFVAFDIATDYVRYVDGKPREDGVRSFVASRGLAVSDAEIRAIADRKHELVQRHLREHPVTTYAGSLRYLRTARDAGLKTAVVSSSKDTRAVLRSARIEDLFDTQIDGVIAEQRQLAGKPAPDTYLAAARALGVEPAHAAVFEDALAGVEAGRAGRFGRVIGVDRVGQAAALRQHGADVVVADLAELLEA
ncbi:MAG TPA: transketolase [Kofleriaceae bacterium]|jgi:transketolase|nr:transketolase [Kofleriaceae bacterium]